MATYTSGSISSNSVSGSYLKFSWSRTNSGTNATINWTVTLYATQDGSYTSSGFNMSISGYNGGSVSTSSIWVQALTVVAASGATNSVSTSGSFTVYRNNSGNGGFKVSGSTSIIGSTVSFSDFWAIDQKVNYTACTAPNEISATPSIVTPSGEITVTWKGAQAGTNNAINGYTIYYRVGAEPTTSTYTGTKSASSSPASFSLSSAERGKIVYIKIVTKGSVSGYNSSISSVKASVVVNSLPGAPTVSGSSGTVAPGASLRWTVTAGSDSNSGQPLSLYYSIGSGTKNKFTSPLSLTASSTRSNSTTYNFYTYDGLEYSSATSKTITINASKPAAPTVTGSSGTVVPKASLNWTVTGTGTLYYNTSNSTSSATSFTSPKKATASSTRGSSTTYYFWAYDGVEFSNAATKVITIATLPAAPTLKNGSTALTSGGSTVISSGGSFSITATGTSVNYNSSTTTPSPGATSSTTMTIATSATSGSAYTYYFWSFNSLGEASDKVSFTVKKNKVPNTPTISIKSGIKTISGNNYFPDAGGSISLNITSGANTNYNNNTYIYYTTATTIPSTSLSKIAISGAETKTITTTLPNTTTTATYRAWVYDGLEFSSNTALTLKKLSAPTTITWGTMTINTSYALGSNYKGTNGKYAWYITACQAKHNAQVPANVTYQLAMLQTNGCTEATTAITSNLVSIKSFNAVNSNTFTTSFAYNVYNAIAEKNWNTSLSNKNVGWRIKATVDDGVNPAISTFYSISGEASKYFTVSSAPTITTSNDIFNKDWTSNVNAATISGTTLYFYQNLYVSYYKDAAMTGTPEATLKIGNTTYTPIVTINSEGTTYSSKQQIKIAFTNAISLSSNTTATLTLKLKHATAANAYKNCTISGTLKRVRDLPSISAITLPVSTYKPYEPTTGTNYSIKITNTFPNVTTSASLKSEFFIPYAVSTVNGAGFNFQIANSSGTTAQLATVTTSGTPFSDSKWQFQVPAATLFSWSNNVGSGKLWTSSQLYGNQTYKIRPIVKDYFGRIITGSYSGNGTFNFDYTPKVTFKILGNTYGTGTSESNLTTFSAYPTTGTNLKLHPDQRIKLVFSMNYKSAYPVGGISIPIKINNTLVGTFTNSTALAGETTGVTTSMKSVTFASTPSYVVGALGTGMTKTSIYCKGNFNTTSTTAYSADPLAFNSAGTTNTDIKYYYKSQPWYTPTININSVNIFSKEGTNQITLKYTMATWPTKDEITFVDTVGSSQLYLVTSVSNNPSIVNVRDYHVVLTGTSNRNFSDVQDIIARPTYIASHAYSTTFTIGTALTTNKLKTIQNLTLGGVMHATGGWYLQSRSQWFKSNTVYGRLQTPSMAFRQDNVGFFVNDDDYLGTSTTTALGTATKYHPSIGRETKGVIFVKANTNATAVVIQNVDDTSSFIYDILNGEMTLYTSASTGSSTWTQTHSINFKDGIFK